MLIGLRHPGRAIGYALVLLGVTFAWGALSANVASLRSARPVDGFAHNRAVALPILGAWTLLAFALARRYLHAAGGGGAEGLKLGAVFAAAAFLFDLIVVATLVGEGPRHFGQAVVWLGYVILIVVPWLVGRAA